ncbi:hypothetical protein J6590_036579 [Homalodisca vitripennis]|nr:hypothetical protein J6590_036579 [Homalodisca vitripennis]
MRLEDQHVYVKPIFIYESAIPQGSHRSILLASFSVISGTQLYTNHIFPYTALCGETRRQTVGLPVSRNRRGHLTDVDTSGIAAIDSVGLLQRNIWDTTNRIFPYTALCGETRRQTVGLPVSRNRRGHLTDVDTSGIAAIDSNRIFPYTALCGETRRQTVGLPVSRNRRGHLTDVDTSGIAAIDSVGLLQRNIWDTTNRIFPYTELCGETRRQTVGLPVSRNRRGHLTDVDTSGIAAIDSVGLLQRNIWDTTNRIFPYTALCGETRRQTMRLPVSRNRRGHLTDVDTSGIAAIDSVGLLQRNIWDTTVHRGSANRIFPYTALCGETRRQTVGLPVSRNRRGHLTDVDTSGIAAIDSVGLLQRNI